MSKVLRNDSSNGPCNETSNDGVDRRGFLECMAWAGSGLVWTLSGGLPAARSSARRLVREHERLFLRADQRQSHRLRQGPEQRRRWHAAIRG